MKFDCLHNLLRMERIKDKKFFSNFFCMKFDGHQKIGADEDSK